MNRQTKNISIQSSYKKKFVFIWQIREKKNRNCLIGIWLFSFEIKVSAFIVWISKIIENIFQNTWFIECKLQTRAQWYEYHVWVAPAHNIQLMFFNFVQLAQYSVVQNNFSFGVSSFFIWWMHVKNSIKLYFNVMLTELWPLCIVYATHSMLFNARIGRRNARSFVHTLVVFCHAFGSEWISLNSCHACNCASPLYACSANELINWNTIALPCRQSDNFK